MTFGLLLFWLHIKNYYFQIFFVIQIQLEFLASNEADQKLFAMCTSGSFKVCIESILKGFLKRKEEE